MLTDFLPTVVAATVRDKAVELARQGGPDRFEDSWKLAAILAEVGELSLSAEALTALVSSVPTSADWSSMRNEMSIDLGQMLMMLGDEAGARLLQKAERLEPQQRGLTANAIHDFYAMRPTQHRKAPPAGGDRLKRLMDRWWETSRVRTDRERVSTVEAERRRLAHLRAVRAWLRAASPEDRGEYERVSRAIADLPRKVTSDSVTQGTKVTVRLGVSPELSALLGDQAAVLRRKVLPPGSPDRLGESPGIDYLEPTARDSSTRRFVDGLRVLCEDPIGIQFAIFEGAAGFVQFAAAGDQGLVGEAVSNAFLEEPHLLSESQNKRLIGMGWQPPESEGNFRREWKEPVDLAEVMLLVASTFDVYGHTLDDVVVVGAG
jgi:hypothetical protein